jgi:RHS repeat-associated protein
VLVAIFCYNAAGAPASASTNAPTRTPGMRRHNHCVSSNTNMLTDGTNSYVWDIENRLITINYPGSGNYTSFTYDGMGNRVKIVETGTLTNTKQFIFAQGGMCEARDAGGTNALNQFYKYGETISGTSYFFTFDQIGSVRELIDLFGNAQAEYSYNPSGQICKIKENVASDFQFAGFTIDARSDLALSSSRAYNPSLGRWLNRDNSDQTNNLFAYAGNAPIDRTDSNGQDWSSGAQRGFQEIESLKGSAMSLCSCEACEVPDHKIASCKHQISEMLDFLAVAWVMQYNQPAPSAKVSERVGGLFCVEWVSSFIIMLDTFGFQFTDIWKYRRQQTWREGNEQHQWLQLYIRDSSDRDKCSVYVDDGYGIPGHHLGHTSPPQPWPGQPLISYPTE